MPTHPNQPPPSAWGSRFLLLTPFLVTVCAAAGPRAQASEPRRKVLADKTFVAWVEPADLAQRGGSVLTLEKTGGVFDAIVFGELEPGRWMAGSENFRRTKREQAPFPSENAGTGALVQVAITWQGTLVTLHRNGVASASYHVEAAETFGDDARVLIGLRHLGAAPGNRSFHGSVADARIYDIALTAAQLAALRPDTASQPTPHAWWDFEAGSAADRMRHFGATTLHGGARLEGGRLHLDGDDAFLLATHDSLASLQSAASTDHAVLARDLREHLLRDPHRPGYHFVVPEGRAMPFDPNGAIFWKGRYHLFYIFQDGRGHNWGHVSSTDLLHWRHHPTGLVSGMFSGNCFLDGDGRPTVCYHQVGLGNAMAVALDDDLDAWEKLASNPITPRTEPGDPMHGRYRSWDPFGWREGDVYYAIFGGTRPALAKAPSLGGPWRYVGDLLANTVPGAALDEDVSCADFFQLGDKHVLLCISHRLGCRYYLGDWRDEQFHPTSHARLSFSDHSFFAPESLLDDRGRRIFWAWVLDRPDFGMRTDAGWSGTMSLPRVLALGADGTLRMAPPAELERLRFDGKAHADVTIPAAGRVPLAGVDGRSLEIKLTLRSEGATRFGLAVCRSPDGEEETLVYYDVAAQTLAIDTRAASLTEGPKGIEQGPLALTPGETVTLRVFVDRSIVEVFANGRQAVVRRIYPSRQDSTGVALFAHDGAAAAGNIRTFRMAPTNPH